MQDLDGVILCHLEALEQKEFQVVGELWSKVAALYEKQEKQNIAAKFFKQAKSITGKLSEYVKEWSFLGPFVIGKSEVDGDPVAACGGIKEASRHRFKKNVKFYSELVPGGEISWSTVKQSGPSSGLKIQPKVNWNELVNSLGSMGITEWQGWLIGEFAVNENDMDVVIQCLGVHTVYINDVPITGDVYRRDQYWFGVQLDQGVHTVFIKLRTKINAQISCSFQTAKNSFQLLSPSFMPDLVDGRLFGRYISLPVANYHSSKALQISKVVLNDLVPKDSEIQNRLQVKVLKSPINVQPGQIYSLLLELSADEITLPIIPQCSIPESSWDLKFNVKVTTSMGVSSLPLALRCRQERQSFLFTFLDHDGSVQHAASIQPLLVIGVVGFYIFTHFLTTIYTKEVFLSR